MLWLKRNRFCFSALICIAFLMSGPATGQETADPAARFLTGNAYYRQGAYDKALSVYRDIASSGWVSGSLWFNMGNCHYKLQDIGHAVLCYERAARLLPGDEDVKTNLEMARMQVRDEIVPIREFFLFRITRDLLEALNRSVLRALILIFYFLAAAMIIVSWLSRARRLQIWGRRLALTCIAAGILSGMLYWGQWNQSRNRVSAIILADRVTVKSAPGEGDGVDLFTLHEGTKVRVDNRSGDWIEIVLADGKVGWIEESALEII